LAVLIRNALLIVNPASRRGQWLLDEALAAFRNSGVGVDFFQTEQAGHGGEIASELAHRYDATFTLGGDGTADEVIGALAGTSVAVGVLPGGTGNLLARTLQTPLSIRRAVPALLGGWRYRCDLGLVGDDRYFVFSLGIGADARMMAETSSRLKRVFGVVAYVFSATRVSFLRKPTDVVIEVDGERLERRATMTMVANFGSVLSDFLRLGPGIVSDDGVLNVCIISPVSHLDVIRVVWKMIVKDFSQDPCMEFRTGKHVRIESQPPTAVQADGELLGETPVEVRIRPMSTTLLVPAWFGAGEGGERRPAATR
jgi:YegS/Rv2252/BmrU family lipid kinase